MKDNLTPGEWEIKDETFIVSGNTTIAEFYNNESYMPRAGTTVPTVEESQTNARLIAEAKNLLKMLEVAMYEVKDWHEYNYNQIDSFEDRERSMQVDVANSIYDKLQAIKSVIKKAKGQ